MESPLSRRALAREIRRAAAPLPAAARWHLGVRFRSAPWDRVLDALEPEGDLLDVGCGPGLLAFLLGRAGFAGTYLGVDPDGRKVARARRWLPETERRRFLEGSVDAAGKRRFARVAIVDVLYLVPAEERNALVAAASSRLAPGGLLVALTSGGGPPWKRALDRLQEGVAVALGITRGAAVSPCDGAELARCLSAAGLGGVEVRDAGAGYVHGFEIARGRAPE